MDAHPETITGAAGPMAGPETRGEAVGPKNLAGHDLSGADLTGADLAGANLLRTNLRGAKLARADLRGAEMTGANLQDADLEEADATKAGLGHADLRGAHLFGTKLEGATLTKAKAAGADLRCAVLRGARLREIDLAGADLTSADLRDADLSLSNVSGAVLDNANLQGARLRAVGNFTSARWLGTDIRNVNFAGAYRLRRFVIDQNYIKEFRESGRWAHLVYWIWWATSDCGRSVFRWCACIAALVLLYAWMFTKVTVDFGPHAADWPTAIYYSVVTLTTLGYGDVLPASRPAQFVVIFEVVTGYVMLGGLLSIFANKLARRGD